MLARTDPDHGLGIDPTGTLNHQCTFLRKPSTYLNGKQGTLVASDDSPCSTKVRSPQPRRGKIEPNVKAHIWPTYRPGLALHVSFTHKQYHDCVRYASLYVFRSDLDASQGNKPTKGTDLPAVLFARRNAAVAGDAVR